MMSALHAGPILDAHTVVLDRQPQATAPKLEGDPAGRGDRVPGHVAQGLARDCEELDDRLDRQRRDAMTGIDHIDADDHATVALQLGRQLSKPVGEIARLEQDRSQAEDEVADVADDGVEGIDGLVHTAARLVGVLSRPGPGTSSSARVCA